MEQLSGMLSSAPGGSGTKDYEQLENKPSINGIELLGQLSLKDLGMMSAEELQQLAEEMEGKIPGKTSELENDSTFQTEEQVNQKIQETEGKIPGKTSDLENDSTFQTEEQVDQKIQEIEKKIPDVTDLEKSVEELVKQVEELQKTVDAFVDGNEVEF